MSEAKAKSAIENGKKGGKPPQLDFEKVLENFKNNLPLNKYERKALEKAGYSNNEINGKELKVTKDGKPRKLKLENDGGNQYRLYIVYPDGQQVRAKIQPEKSGIPNIKFLAEKNGFEF